MDTKRAIVTGLVLFVVFYILEFVIHGKLLASIYQETASVWRPEEDMKQLMWLMLVGQAFFSFFFGIIYAAGYETTKPNMGQGLRFGILMACLISPLTSFSWYAILPIPGILAVYWLIASVVEMLILGLVAGAVYKPQSMMRI